MYNPLVSIIIPCYNHELFILEAIESAISQDYENIELIIIDDGSSDLSVSTINTVLDKCKSRFKRFEFRYRPNVGLSNTLNEALLWCKGDYIEGLASDDVLLPNKTSLQVEFLNNNSNCAGVFGGYELIDCSSNIECSVLKKKNSFNFDDVFLNKHNLPSPTQMIRREILNKIGGYKSGIVLEDWYMWLSLTSLGYTLDYLDIIFAKYRKHDNNTSANLALMDEAREDVLLLFREYPNYNLARAKAKLISAFKMLPIKKIKALNLFFEAINIDIRVTYSFSFYNFLRMFFLPKRFLNKIR